MEQEVISFFHLIEHSLPPPVVLFPAMISNKQLAV